jgi:prepilin-type N-terminal cleavage/methylation domain-containing protein
LGAEDGFSLMELLIVVAVMPLIAGAIAVALLSIFSNDTGISNGLTASGDTQVSSTDFVRDVQSASFITTAPSNGCTGNTGSLLLSLSTDSAAPTTTTGNVISYVETANPGTTTHTIHRETCSSGYTPATTDVVVSHNALPTSTLTVTPTPPNLSSQWVGAQGVSSIVLQVFEPSTSTGSPNTINLTATPRVTSAPLTGPNAAFNPIVPMMLLGSSCLTVNGSLVDAQNGTGFIGFGGSAPCVSNNGGTIQSASPYETGEVDPFQNLAPPAPPSTLPPAALGCSSGTPPPITCGSGLYSNTTLNFGNGGGILTNPTTFDPSVGSSPNVFVFTQPVTIRDNSNVIFEGGASLTDVTYWFMGGLSITGSNGTNNGSTVTFGPATYIFGTSGSASISVSTHSVIQAPNGSTGLIFYIPPGTTGQATFSSGTNGAILGSPSPYDQIALWDASSGGVKLGGTGGSGTICLGGIYVPNVAPPSPPNVAINYQGNYSVTSTFMVANGATIGGGSTATETGSSMTGSC